MRLSLPLTTALALTLATAHARAADPAAAQVLFEEGKRLADAQKFALACPKFEESQRLDPGLGTLFHFADCEEHLGKTATAWAAFLEVASVAHTQGEAARESAARARANAVEPRVPKLTIDPGAMGNVPGLQLTRDGAPIGHAQWATAVPVDPGAHTIEAHAPGKIAWTTRVNLTEGVGEVVAVPALRDAPSPPIAAATPSPAAPVSTTNTTSASAEAETNNRGHGQRVAGVALGAAGIVALGVGGAFGIDSIVRHDQAQSHCGANGCDSSGVSMRNDARMAGDASTIAFAGGGALLLVGILTYVTAPRPTPIGLGSDGASAQRAARSTPDYARVTFDVGPGSAMVRGVW